MSFKKTADTLTKGAHTLDRDFYTSPQILNNEYEKIFQSKWICVGRSEELTKIGVGKLFGPGTPVKESLDYIENWVKDNRR